LWYAVCWGLWHHHSRAAANHLRQRDFDGALKHLSWCRWAWSSDAETWLLSARTARRGGHFEQARDLLDQAKQRGARPRRVQLERALLSAQQGQFREVEDTLHDLLRTSRSDYPFIAEVLTEEYMRLYRFAEARALLNRWIELNDEDVEAHLRRGWVAEHQLDFDQALRDYREVLAREPDRGPVRLRVAEILLKVRRPAEAIEELGPIQERPAIAVEAALLLARCQRELGRLAEADAALDALPDDQRQAPRALAERGQIALGRGQLSAAEDLLRRALRDLPRERDVLHALQQVLARQGKSVEAEEIRGALKQADADGRRLSDLMKELGRAPTDAGLRYECAQIFLRNNLTDDAIRWLRMTLEVKPTHRQAHEHLAVCYEKQGARERASYHRAAARRLGGKE
jgi:tetratricopeptide (TPR) repeat protein